MQSPTWTLRTATSRSEPTDACACALTGSAAFAAPSVFRHFCRMGLTPPLSCVPVVMFFAVVTSGASRQFLSTITQASYSGPTCIAYTNFANTSGA